MEMFKTYKECMRNLIDEHDTDAVNYAKQDNLKMAYFAVGLAVGIQEALDGLDTYVDFIMKHDDEDEDDDANEEENNSGSIDSLIESIEKFIETCKLPEDEKEEDDDKEEKSDFGAWLENFIKKLEAEEDEQNEHLRELLEKFINDALFSGKSVAKVRVRTKE